MLTLAFSSPRKDGSNGWLWVPLNNANPINTGGAQRDHTRLADINGESLQSSSQILQLFSPGVGQRRKSTLWPMIKDL